MIPSPVLPKSKTKKSGKSGEKKKEFMSHKYSPWSVSCQCHISYNPKSV